MQVAPRVELDLDNIQGNIVPGFYKDAQDYFFLRFSNPEQGRAWLLQLVEKDDGLSSARRVNAANDFYRKHRKESEEGWANVAISAAGLEFLGVDVSGFPDAFIDTPEVRAQVLGDAAVANTFEVGGTSETEAHALLILGANYPPLKDGETDPTIREKHMEALHEKYGVNASKTEVRGIRVSAHFQGRSLGNGKEHFGFFDSLSQPVPHAVVESTGWPSNGQLVAPGEFILGQPGEPNGKPMVELPEPEWARNGSYVVFRAMRQDVVTFEETMETLAAELTAHGAAIDKEQLMGQMMGRRRDDRYPHPSFYGEPYPDHCPFFAHVRKANPRDGVAGKSRLHRIIRRGIPYGPHATRGVGLLFVAYQASIARQFEHIQTQWLASDALPHPATHNVPLAISPMAAPGPDPLTAWPAGGERTVMYHVPGRGLDYADFLHVKIPTLVDVIGSGYFFSPAINQIQSMLESDRDPRAASAPLERKRRTLVTIKPNDPQPASEAGLASTTPPRANGSAIGTLTAQPTSTAAVEEPPVSASNINGEFANPSNYSVLGAIIEMHRPYADDALLPDLRNGALYRHGLRAGNSPQIAGNSIRLDTVDVFGALADAGAGHNGRARPQVEGEGAEKKVVIPPADTVQENLEGVFEIRLNNGEPFRITKGLRIPYRYTDMAGNPILGNIIVLYNGTGHPC